MNLRIWHNCWHHISFLNNYISVSHAQFADPVTVRTAHIFARSYNSVHECSWIKLPVRLEYYMTFLKITISLLIVLCTVNFRIHFSDKVKHQELSISCVSDKIILSRLGCQIVFSRPAELEEQGGQKIRVSAPSCFILQKQSEGEISFYAQNCIAHFIPGSDKLSYSASHLGS